jgi:hypothetical protein
LSTILSICCQPKHASINYAQGKTTTYRYIQTKKANSEIPLCRLNIGHHAIAYVLVILKMYCCYELFVKQKVNFQNGNYLFMVVY